MNQSTQSSTISSAADEAFCSLIRKVHHLIEVCLTYNVDQQQCAHLLQLHAGIQPAITLTVWRELEKSNPDFFQLYSKKQTELQSSTTVLQDVINIMHQN